MRKDPVPDEIRALGIEQIRLTNERRVSRGGPGVIGPPGRQLLQS